jgi:hypothetical protein
MFSLSLRFPKIFCNYYFEFTSSLHVMSQHENLKFRCYKQKNLYRQTFGHDMKQYAAKS